MRKTQSWVRQENQNIGLLRGGDFGFDLQSGRLWAGFGKRNIEIVTSNVNYTKTQSNERFAYKSGDRNQDFKAKRFTLGDNGTIFDFNSEMLIKSVAPQMQFHDTNHNVKFWVHVNSKKFYILTNYSGTGGWNGAYPFVLINDNKKGYIYGGEVYTSINKPIPQWTNLPLSNAWQNYGEVLKFSMDILNNVSITGKVRNGQNNKPIATLPVDFRPTQNKTFVCVAGERFIRIDINTSGQIIPISTSSVSFISLEINFRR